MSTPSRRFLAQLPPALFESVDPDAYPPLLALLGAVEEQWLTLAANVDEVLDDVFADTASDWALPYLAEVLGLPADAGRVEIGYATALRRRRGTPAALEDFSTVVTGWPARVTEGWQTVAWCQRLSHPVKRHASISLRAGEHLLIDSQLDTARRSLTPGGPSHPAAVLSTVFPWQVYRLAEVEAAPLGEPGRFALHPLAIDSPLYLRPEPLAIASDADDQRPPGVEPVARPPRAVSELPLRASWRLLEALAVDRIGYGPVWTLLPGHPVTAGGETDPALVTITVGGVVVPWSAIGLTSLPAVGAPAPAAGQVLLDPSRGTVSLGSDFSGTVRSTFYRPASGHAGALASTAEVDDLAANVIVVDPSGAPHAPGQLVVATLQAAVDAALALPAPTVSADVDVEIRLDTSDRLAAPAPITGAPAAKRWRIVASAGISPVIVGALELRMPEASVELVGCFLEGDLVVGAELSALQLAGVTMNTAAGRMIRIDPTAWTLRFSASLCHLGAIRADLGAFPLELTDCVVDGAGVAPTGCGTPAAPGPVVNAVAAADAYPPQLTTAGTTFAGGVAVDTIEASDCLFLDGIRTIVTSAGCLRFSHLGAADDPQAHPKAYQCLVGPVPALAGVGAETVGYYAPVLRSPGYRGADPVLTGASDGGEQGAYHHARRGPLAARLADRLPEMTPLTVHPHLSLTRQEE